MIYPVVPKPYHRMTQRSKWSDEAKVYNAWKNDLQKLRFDIPDAGAVIVFRMPMPRSWSQKKRREMDGRAHQQRPDIDNLIKAALDAAKQYRGGDHTIWHIGGVMKVWSEDGEIEVRVPN